MEMWFSEFHTPDVKHSIRVNRQLFSRQPCSDSGRKCNADGA